MPGAPRFCCCSFSLFAVRRFRHLSEDNGFVGLGFAFVLSLNPFFCFTAGRAWNHDLPVLALVGAYFAFLRVEKSDRAWLWLALCGPGVGLAAGTRLSFAPMAAPFILAIFFFPCADRKRFVSSLHFGDGLALALLPVGLLFSFAPRQFLFDNFTHNHAINLLFRAATVPREITFWHKLSFPFQYFLRSPADVLLLVGFVWFALLPWWRSGWAGRKQDREISLLQAIPSLLSSLGGLAPATWPVFAAHAKAEAIAALLPRGRVLTLAPLFPPEAGRDIYLAFATGPFAWRTAPFIGMVSARSLALSARPISRVISSAIRRRRFLPVSNMGNSNSRWFFTPGATVMCAIRCLGAARFGCRRNNADQRFPRGARCARKS